MLTLFDREETAKTIRALIVALVCGVIAFGLPADGTLHRVLGTLAVIVGFCALIVVVYRILAWILGLPRKIIRYRQDQISSRISHRIWSEKHERLLASRERHRANRSEWLRCIREGTGIGPSSDEGTRAAIVWLNKRQGKTVTIRQRLEDRVVRYQYGERNATDWRTEEPTKWESRKWIVQLPDEALTPREHDDFVDESQVAVSWETLGITWGIPSVTLDERGIELRSTRRFNDVNEYDHGPFGTYVEVVRIEE